MHVRFILIVNLITLCFSTAMAQHVRADLSEFEKAKYITSLNMLNDSIRHEIDRNPVLAKVLIDKMKSLTSDLYNRYHDEIFVEFYFISLIRMGMLYTRNLDYTNAARILNFVLQSSKELGYRRVEGQALNGLGLLYERIGTFDQALQCYVAEYRLTHATNDSLGMAASSSNIGNILSRQERFEKAIPFTQEALKLAIALKDSIGMVICYGNIGTSQIAQGNYSIALPNVIYSIDIATRLQLKGFMALGYINLATLYNKTNDLGLAKIAVDEAEKILESSKDISLLTMLLEQESEILSKLNQNEAANTVLRDLISYKDTLSKRTSEYQLTQAMAADKYKSDVERLTVEKELQDVRVSTAEKQRLFLLVIAGLMLLLLFVFLSMYRKRIMINKDLKHSNALLEKAQTDLVEINRMKDKFIAILSHDIRSPVSGFRNMCESLRKEGPYMESDLLFSQLSILSLEANKLSELISSILQWTALRTGKQTHEAREVDAGVLCFRVVNQCNAEAEKRSISIHNEIPEGSLIKADPQMLMAIVRNLISNAIKFSPNNSIIRLSAKECNDYFCITVKDQGIGISEDDQLKLFRIDTDYKLIEQAHPAKGSGLGLLLCDEFAKINGGKLSVKSKQGVGSEFTLSIPYK